MFIKFKHSKSDIDLGKEDFYLNMDHVVSVKGSCVRLVSGCVYDLDVNVAERVRWFLDTIAPGLQNLDELYENHREDLEVINKSYREVNAQLVKEAAALASDPALKLGNKKTPAASTNVLNFQDSSSKKVN